MPNITSTGGISFAGPLALSGLALSKEYLLKLMDNYMGYMIGMYSLMTENVEAYASAILLQAESEKNQMVDQAWGDFGSGLAEGFGMICSAGIALGGTTYQTRGLNSELGEMETSRKNLVETHSEMIETTNMPKEQLSASSRSGEAIVGDEGEPTEEERTADLNRHRRVLETLGDSNQDDLKALGKKDSPKRKEVREAIIALRKNSEASLALSAPERMAKEGERRDDDNRIKKATKSVHKHIEYLDGKERNIHSQIEGIQRRWQSRGELVKGLSGILGGGVRFYETNEAAADKYKAAQAAGAVQMAQSSVQQSEKTATDASGQASDLIRQLKELQANNSSRA